MFERFTDRTRKVLVLANQTALRLNHAFVDTRHVLLGMVQEGAGNAAMALAQHGVTEEKLLGLIPKKSSDMIVMGKLPNSSCVKTMFENAVEEASGLNHNYVGTEHLLLAIVRDHTCAAHLLLMDLGIVFDSLRFSVLTKMNETDKQVKVQWSWRDLNKLPPLEDDCPDCENGKVEVRLASSGPMKVTCEYCNGRGKVPNEQGEALLDFLKAHLKVGMK